MYIDTVLELDTELMEFCLPETKLISLSRSWNDELVRGVVQRGSCSHMIGRLTHTCSVIPPGKTFLHQMMDLSIKPKKLLTGCVRLTESFR